MVLNNIIYASLLVSPWPVLRTNSFLGHSFGKRPCGCAPLVCRNGSRVAAGMSRKCPKMSHHVPIAVPICPGRGTKKSPNGTEITGIQGVLSTKTAKCPTSKFSYFSNVPIILGRRHAAVCPSMVGPLFLLDWAGAIVYHFGATSGSPGFVNLGSFRGTFQASRGV